MTVQTNDSGNQGDGSSTGGTTKDTTKETSETKETKGGEADGGSGDDNLDESTLDAKTQNYLKKMRAENAKHRTRANKVETELEGVKAKLKGLAGGEEDDTPPEKKIEELASSVNSLSMENAILSIAVQNNIGADSLDYFKFLVGKRAGELEEGEELTDEDLKPIIAEVKSKLGKSTQTSTSVTPNQNNTNPDGGGEITLEQFAKMGIMDKSTLYRKNPKLYESLMAQAKEKKLLIR